MVLSGRKVARPASRFLSISIARFASESVLTTMCCILAPRATSMATLYFEGTLIRVVTGPQIPPMDPFFDSFMTTLTLL